jgi:hypothetical protein
VTTRKPVEAKSGAVGKELLESLGKTRMTDRALARLHSVRVELGSIKDKKVSGRISGDLLSAVKARLGVVSDTEAIEMALANMAVTDDFGSWLIDQGGALSADFKLEL